MLCRRFVKIDEEKKDSLREVKATRKHVGMMGIIGHMGDEFGVDGNVHKCTDRTTADKILSMADHAQTFLVYPLWQDDPAVFA